jgi:uncharacterized OsmC-like protein
MAQLGVRRAGEHAFVGENDRGALVDIGLDDAEGSFTAGELLQLAVAACAAVTTEQVITRRTSEDSTFAVHARRDRREGAHEFDAIHIGFDLDVSGLDETERARLESIVRHSLEEYCTVSRSIEKGTPVKVTFPEK